VPKSEVGSVSGESGAIAEVFVIGLTLILGLIFDTVGRKVPTVVGFIMAGSSIIVMPYLAPSIADFYVLRVTMSLGIIPGLNTPLMPDYVQQKSLGLANAYVRFMLC
jgi:MFS family permease